MEIINCNVREVLSIGFKDKDDKRLTILFYLESRQYMLLNPATWEMQSWGKWVITDENHILFNVFKDKEKNFIQLNEQLEKEVFKWLAERELLKNSADTTINNIQQGSNDEQSTPKSD